MSRTLVLIKPDAVKKDAWRAIIKRYEELNLRIIASLILAPMSSEVAQELYLEHKGKSFYNNLIHHMTHGITIALMVCGHSETVKVVREINGATKPEDADIGTIRYCYGTKGGGPANAVHSSATPTDAERELKLIFG